MVLASGNAAPSLQSGKRPRVSESYFARDGARINRMERSGNGPIPGKSRDRSANSASDVASGPCPGQATAVIRPTSIAVGGGGGLGRGPRLSKGISGRLQERA